MKLLTDLLGQVLDAQVGLLHVGVVVEHLAVPLGKLGRQFGDVTLACSRA